MKKLFVPYELAVQLKEKGFNEPCLCCYRGNALQLAISTSGYLSDTNFEVNSDLNDATGYWVAAPLYQQIVDWFREKHDIFIDIRRAYWRDNDVEYNDFIYPPKSNVHLDITLGNEFPTYYEALDNAIKEALKLI